MVVYERNQLLIRTIRLVLLSSCIGSSCARDVRDSRIESILVILSSPEVASGQPQIVIDVTSLQTARMDSAAVVELGKRLPLNAKLGIPSVYDVCSQISGQICSGVWLRSYADSGSTALIRALWGRVVAPGRCSGASEATFEIDTRAIPHRVTGVKDVDHGSCGWEPAPSIRDSIR